MASKAARKEEQDPRRAEEADSSLELFFDLSVAAQVLAASDGTILLANKSFGQIVGRSREELARASLFDLLAQGPNGHLRARLASALHQSKTPQEIRFERPDGEVLWLLLSSAVDAGKERAVLHLRDVSRQHHIQNAIRALAAGPVGKEDTIWNLLARSLAEALGVRCAFVAKLLPPGAEGLTAHTLALQVQGKFFEAVDYPIAGTPSELVLRDKVHAIDHSVRAAFPGNWLLNELQAEGYIGLALTDSSGRQIGILTVIDDKPLGDLERMLEVLRLFALRAGSELEKEAAVESLRLSEERFDRAVRGTSHGLWDWNIETGEFYAAPGYRQILGHADAGDFPTQIDSISAWVHPDDLEACRRAYRRHLEEGAKYDLEFRMRHASGDYIWLRSRAKVNCDEAGRPVRMSGSIVDVTARKAAQLAMMSSQERMQKLTAGVPGAVFEIEQDAQGVYRLAFVSDGARSLLGLEEGEALEEKVLLDRLDLRSRTMLLNALVKSNLRGKPLTREIPLAMRDGQRRWLQIKAVPERGADGRTSWRGLLMDITQSKLERLEQQAVAAVAQFCLECLDLEGLYEAVPRLLASHFGLQGGMVRRFDRAGMLVIMGGYRLPEAGPFRPEKAGETSCGLAIEENRVVCRCRQGEIRGTAYEDLWNMRTLWSVPLWLGNTALGSLCLLDRRPIAANEPFKRSLLAVASSLSQAIHRLETAAQLRASEERYRRLVELSPVGIFMAREGRFVYANPTLVRMFGYSKQSEILGRNLYAHLREERKAPVRDLLSEVEQQGREFSLIEEKFLRADGGWFEAEFSTTNIQMDGRPVSLVVVRDTTEHNQLEEAQAKSARLESVGALAGGIAHDFNNFLAGMMTSLSVLQLDGRLGHESRSCLRDALEACKAAQQLTKQLLTFGKGGSPVKEITRLDDLVEQSARFVLRGSKLDIQFDLASGLWPANIDAGQIRQVLHNLVLNARQAMRDGGKLSLTARNLEGEAARKTGLAADCAVEITVEDSGPGIPEELQHRVFDPYFSTKEDGTGLGLAVCHSIVKKHDGIIGFQSNPGKGCAFRVILPALRKACPETHPEEPAAQKGTGRILVMDDNDMILKTLSRLLQKLGYEPTLSRHGEECLAVYQDARKQGKPFDAVILDLTIQGGMGGAETVLKLRECDPAVRAIASSGYADDDSMTNYEQNGFDAVLPKPYTHQAISQVLQRMLKPGATPRAQS
jgi:PAS domain S-box-containing protein